MRLTGDERSMGCGSPQPPLHERFFWSAETFAELGQREAGFGAHSKWMRITGNSSIRRLNRVAFVMGLHEFAPVGGWAASEAILAFSRLRTSGRSEPAPAGRLL